MNNKDCNICVYDDVCPTYRRIDVTIIDCCIPEAELRKRQKIAFAHNDVVMFAAATHNYIRVMKSKSEYWKKEKD